MWLYVALSFPGGSSVKTQVVIVIAAHDVGAWSVGASVNHKVSELSQEKEGREGGRRERWRTSMQLPGPAALMRGT